MNTKAIKQKFLKQKQQTNIYMQKTQGPKPSMSSPLLDQRLKSHTLLNKQNYPPNIQKHKPINQNSFGAVKMMMRQSVDDLKLQMNKTSQVQYMQYNHDNRIRNPKQHFGSKSINFDQYHTERAFIKKNLKTQQDCENDQKDIPMIQDCQFIKSQYEQDQDSSQCQQQRLNYAKCYYQRPSKGTLKNNNKNILVHESLDLDLIDKSRDVITFGPAESKHIKKYQLSREQQKKMKNQIVNNIIKNTKAQLMRSWDGQVYHSIPCINHINKKAKYRLNADLTEGEEQSYYCSKCAINLIRQGFEIEQIQDLEYKKLQLQKSIQIKKQEIHRQQQFITIQKRIEQLKGKISAKLQQFSQKSEQMTKMDKRIELTVSNYTQLIQILKQMKKQQLQKQQKSREEKSLDINLKKDQLSTILNNIRDTSLEISNQKNKLLALKNKQFSFMFDTYINKIASYQNYLKNLQQTQLSLQIATFDQNIDCQDIDQDTMINDIFKEMFQRLTTPKLQALQNHNTDSKDRKYAPLKSLSHLNKSKCQGIQSGGSSIFYCQQVEEQTVPPFRILFKDSRTEQSINCDRTVHNHSNTYNSQTHKNILQNNTQNHHAQNIRYFKQENPLRKKFN